MNLEKEAKRPESTTTAVVKRKQNQYHGTFSVIYTPLPLAMLLCETLNSDTMALIKTMAFRHVYRQDDMPTGQACFAVRGRETTHLRYHLDDRKYRTVGPRYYI